MVGRPISAAPYFQMLKQILSDGRRNGIRRSGKAYDGGAASVRIGRGTATMGSWPMRSYSAIT
jgi:hypothetical protein